MKVNIGKEFRIKKLHIKKEDTVVVISGKEKGKKGRVLKIFPEKERIIVERVNMIKRHSRPSIRNRQGGIVEREGTIHASNVLLYCPKCDKPVRIGHRFLEDQKKVRACRKCGEILDRL